MSQFSRLASSFGMAVAGFIAARIWCGMAAGPSSPVTPRDLNSEVASRSPALDAGSLTARARTTVHGLESLTQSDFDRFAQDPTLIPVLDERLRSLGLGL